MTTEFTNNVKAVTLFIPEEQPTTKIRSDEEDQIADEINNAGGDVAEEELVVSTNRFTREDAIQFLTFDVTSCIIPPKNYIAIGKSAFDNTDDIGASVKVRVRVLLA